MHTLIVGGTGWGKTTYAIQTAHEADAIGRRVLILDPMWDTRWPEEAMRTTDPGTLESLARDEEYLNAWIFIDEGHDSIGTTRWNTELHWLFRYGRHFGHRVVVITQHPSDLPPIVRGQCRQLVSFNLDGVSAQQLGRQFGCPKYMMETAPTLGQFEYIYLKRGNPLPHKGIIRV